MSRMGELVRRSGTPGSVRPAVARLLFTGSLAGVALAVFAPCLAAAHLNGIPTIAWPSTPEGVGEVADESYRISWTDFDEQATTGETTIDIYATRRMPPTYRMGVVPRFEEDADRVLVAAAIPERDLANVFEWDTSSITPGTWFVWTVAHDDPFEMWAFARGVVSVAHDGELPWPAVIVSRPDEGSTLVGDESVLLHYESFDPDGTARVTLEATRSLDGGDLVTIAEDLPADPAGSFVWDTREVGNGDWMIKATIVDSRGLSSSAFGRAFVRIAHRAKGTGGTGGGGGNGGAGGLGGTSGVGAGGTEGEPGDDPGRGCGCRSASGDALALAFAALLLSRSKRASCGSGAQPPA